MFYNYSSEPFTYTWGNKPFTFASGKVYEGMLISDDGSTSLMLNEVTSRFFAKHLAEHLMNFIGKGDSFETKLQSQGYPMKYNVSTMEMLTERGINPPSKDVMMPEFVSDLPLIRNEVQKPDPALEVSAAPAKEVVDGQLVEPKAAEEPLKKKAGRPKKVASPSPEAVFEGV